MRWKEGGGRRERGEVEGGGRGGGGEGGREMRLKEE